MNRSEFLGFLAASALSGLSVLALQDASSGDSSSTPRESRHTDAVPDFSIRIAPVKLELLSGHTTTTAGYNGRVPGPLLRVKEGQHVTIDVRNNSDVPEVVHWHGLMAASNVDGAMEEGTPMVPAGGGARYSFVARPSGTSWYHTHAIAGNDLRCSLYSGQYGFFYIEPKGNPGRYDREIFIAMHHWEPYFVSMQDINKGPPPNNDLRSCTGRLPSTIRLSGMGSLSE